MDTNPISSSQKVSKPWISSSFGLHDDLSILSHKSSAQKRTRGDKSFPSSGKRSAFSQRRISKLKDDFVPWTEKYFPQTKDDLAVHSKKISEVESWLIESLRHDTNKKQMSSLLLLTGPAGVGKTATIKALSKDLFLDVQEWSSSFHMGSQNSWHRDGMRYEDNTFHITTQSQTTVFSNFLLRANKYSSLFSANCKRIILVEDFPNAFLRDPGSFHNIIRRFYQTGRCPAVFIISDSTSGESAEQCLFPKDLQKELSITNISFNPVAPTMLMKVLNRISNDANDLLKNHKLSNIELEEIAAKSMGDIRNAINSLQFSSIPKKKKEVLKRKQASIKGKENDQLEENSFSSSGRDSSLFLFHALGKILYCKRHPSKNVKEPQLPSHLAHLDRLPLVSDPEEVFSKTSISSEGFTLFLHQNYLSFTEDIQVAANCSSWLSEADIISSEWSDHQTLDSYTASLAARGLMFNLSPSSRGPNRWRPFHKPQWYSSMKHSRNLCLSLKNAFKERQLSLRELQVELIPLLSKIGIPLKDSEQCRMVNQVGTLPVQRSSRPELESLCEKEVYEDNMEGTNASVLNFDFTDSATSNCTDNYYNQDTADEEIVIEEYDF